MRGAFGLTSALPFATDDLNQRAADLLGECIVDCVLGVARLRGVASAFRVVSVPAEGAELRR